MLPDLWPGRAQKGERRRRDEERPGEVLPADPEGRLQRGPVLTGRNMPIPRQTYRHKEKVKLKAFSPA